ncbi:hypothetical protein B296_00001804 [Ensete ventricosum]|uniref:Uncharacterized protein n=1 Tax=Ensete ventricosum TaxID=4639 RepID=A0A427AQJ7_ENSVE|nr:hypothetical protein B296_00001804 [Ensete ventricosum]
MTDISRFIPVAQHIVWVLYAFSECQEGHCISEIWSVEMQGWVGKKREKDEEAMDYERGSQLRSEMMHSQREKLGSRLTKQSPPIEDKQSPPDHRNRLRVATAAPRTRSRLQHEAIA